jgi:hypothetical protein
VIADAAHRKRNASVALAAVTASAIGLLAKQADAEVRFSQNKSNQTISLSGLVDPDANCSLVGIGGRVVKRDFGNDALTITGFVVERADGTRQFVNVDMPANLSMSERDAVFDGLQRLLEQGRVVGGRAVSCGVGGRVLTLESIR